MTTADLARAGYVAYGEALGWTDGDFDDIPPWEALDRQTQGAWTAAVARIADEITRRAETGRVSCL
jgi:hypothetical protein